MNFRTGKKMVKNYLVIPICAGRLLVVRMTNGRMLSDCMSYPWWGVSILCSCFYCIPQNIVGRIIEFCQTQWARNTPFFCLFSSSFKHSHVKQHGRGLGRSACIPFCISFLSHLMLEQIMQPILSYGLAKEDADMRWASKIIVQFACGVIEINNFFFFLDDFVLNNIRSDMRFWFIWHT